MNLFNSQADRERVELLRNLDVFRDLSFKEALEINELLHERVYDKGEIIFEQGDVGHGIYVVVSGKAQVDSQHELLKSAMVEFGPGQMVGELTLFKEGPRFATVIAVERTVMVGLFNAEFSTLLTKNTKIGVKLLVRLCSTICERARHLLLQQRHTPSL